MLGYCGMPLPFEPQEVDVDGRLVKGPWGADYPIQLMGKASLQPDGTWRCLANVGGALCLVQVKVRLLEEHPDCTCLPVGPSHDHSDHCAYEKWRLERKGA